MSHSRKGPGSMNTFVRGKNPQRGDIERLKVDVPQVASGAIACPVASPRGEQSDHETRTEDAWQDQLRTSDAPNPFYGTDASNADETSVASSAKAAFPALPDVQRPDPGTNDQIIGERPASSEDYEDDESDSDVGLDSIEQPTNYNVSQGVNTRNPNFMSVMGKMETDARQRKGDKSFTTKYVAGDSYPSTTSGRLSLSNSDESSRNTSRQQFQTIGPSMHHQGSSHQPILSNHAINDGSNDNALSLNPAHNELLFDAPKFRYDKVPAPSSMMPQRHSMQSNPHIQSMRPAQATHLAQRPSTALGNVQLTPHAPAADFLHPSKPQHQQHYSSLARGGEAILPATKLNENVQRDWPRPPDHRIPQKAVESHHGMSSHFESTKPREHAVDEQMDLGEEEQELDYEPQELRSMDYRTLKGTTFDFEPNSSRFTLPNAQPTDDLTQKLFAASELDRRDQAKFFASLTIDDWEQAGDWFLDRFGDVMKRLKEARREKREAAKRFEDEVEHRHDAVSKRRKLTDDALREMKTSGALVLQGTPRKGRSGA